MRPSVTKGIIVGAIATIGSIAIMIWIFVLHPPQPLDHKDLTIISGSVAEAKEFKNSGGKDLELSVDGQALPFVSFSGVYPSKFSATALKQLASGVQVQIGVPTTEIGSPRTNRSRGQQFYQLVSLQIDGQPALKLSSYNDWRAENQKAAKWLLPIFLAMGLILLVMGIVARRQGRSHF
jgi:hypothetical protein